MTEERGPKRLFEDDDPLLAGHRDDAPPSNLEARIISGMGGGAPPANSGGGSGTPSGGAKLGWKLGLGGAVTAGVAVWLMRSTPAPTPTVDPAPPTSISAAVTAPIEAPPAPIEEEKPPVVPTPTVVVAPPPPLRVRPSASVATSPAPSASAAPAGGLGDEIRALDGVRSSMNGGDANAALTGLDAYDRAFPQGTLKQEAVLLRIDALMRAGRAGDARKLGHAFVEEHPTTPHKKRIQTLLRESE